MGNLYKVCSCSYCLNIYSSKNSTYSGLVVWQPKISTAFSISKKKWATRIEHFISCESSGNATIIFRIELIKKWGSSEASAFTLFDFTHRIDALKKIIIEMNDWGLKNL